MMDRVYATLGSLGYSLVVLFLGMLLFGCLLEIAHPGVLGRNFECGDTR